MTLRAIFTGATGMAGHATLLECIENAEVEEVLVINRSALGLKHPKLKEVIHKDFFDLASINKQLSGFNTCYFCIGVSSVGMSEEKYHHFTYDLTVSFAETVAKLNEGLTFCYVSGAGTDSSEAKTTMWARIKGKTENKLLSMPFKSAYMFRPGYIQPMKGVKTRVFIYQIAYKVLSPLYPILKRVFPNGVTSSAQLSRAMISVSKSGFPKKILETSDINSI